MKFLLKLFVVQTCCLAISVTDAMAREFNRGGGGGREINRPTARPSLGGGGGGTKPVRSPFTGSKVQRPTSQPSTRPMERPSSRPITRPEMRPASRPEMRPAIRPPSRPETLPATRPGNVTYPKPGRPGFGGGNLPGNASNNRPGNANTKPVTRPGQNTRPVQRPNFNQPPLNNRPGSGNGNWWNAGNKRPGNSGNNNNVNINHNVNYNFQNNVNWSTNHQHWGSNPWWNRPATRPWYGGSWNCGWNNHYYRPSYYYGYPGYVVYNNNSVANAIGWGLVGWGLGSLIYNIGYSNYCNPYPVQPVPSLKGEITYLQPITVVAASAAPQPNEAVAASTEKSESFVSESQTAFKQRNYLVALESVNQAIAESPSDGALHEYRALILFALGKFSEAAGVLNPVLASGPGWDWSTMITLYELPETYTRQLKALEKYALAKPEAASAHFLLGYHYMICDHLKSAALQFETAAKLQPADRVSQQLAELVKSSAIPGSSDSEPPAETTEPVAAPAPVSLEKLTGTWVSDKGKDGKITLNFKQDGKFVWNFTKDAKPNEFGGEYSINDDGLLVLEGENSQMVAKVALPQDQQMKFVLSGGPPNDPGLAFAKSN